MAKTDTKVAKRSSLFAGDLMPGALSAELIGTFILTTIVMVTSGNILVVGITVIALVAIFNKISGAHVNPVVTIALLATKQISFLKAFGYIVAQVLGAMLALIVVTQFVTANAATASLGIVPEVFRVSALEGTWVPVFAEMLAGIVFGLGVGAAVIGKKDGLEKAFVVGTAFTTALVLATIGTAGIVNPAVALSVSAYAPGAEAGAAAQWWAIAAYAVAPLVGGAAGAWLYKLMQWDVENAKKK